MLKPIFLLSLLTLCVTTYSFSQSDSFYLLKPARVFDGELMHDDWVVLVKGNKIEQAGSMKFKLPANTRIIEFPGTTLLPGLIEGHAHLFLHPYNETSWNDQVMLESRAERTVRAVNHAKATLMAGFTTVRDLGTEGAGYDDKGLKTSIEKGIIPGPRMLIASRAIVAKGTYGPRLANVDLELPQGAAEVGNRAEMEAEVRLQISKGADLIKIYADYRWGINNSVAPTFSTEEIHAAVEIARASGRNVAVHAASVEGMLRAIAAGVHTIEHGDDATDSVYREMKIRNVALCPTLAAGEATSSYRGWRKGIDPPTDRISLKQQSFQKAIKAGVTICMGGDVGVFAHGDNVREMQLMAEYGMKNLEILKSATSVNAAVFGIAGQVGRIQKGLLADLIVVEGDPSKDVKALRRILFVMKDGLVYKQP